LNIPDFFGIFSARDFGTKNSLEFLVSKAKTRKILWNSGRQKPKHEKFQGIPDVKSQNTKNSKEIPGIKSQNWQH
jgi:hypothetical protein